MKTIVLVGGGHAHLHCIKQWAQNPIENARLVLISPSVFQYYSGMFSGFAEGTYQLDDIRVDLSGFARHAGAVFIEDAITGIDALSRTLTGASGNAYGYDLVSFNIGSGVEIPEFAKEHVSFVKPNYKFPELLLAARASKYPVVVGGGASGVELALSIQAWRKRRGLPLNTVLFSSSSLLIGQGSCASRKIEAIARSKDLSFFTGTSIYGVSENDVTTNEGTHYPKSLILWVTGPKSPELFKRSGLATDNDGYLSVNKFLQSEEFPEIFGAGDCITISCYPSLAKNGVYAVRQAPILWNNMCSSLLGKKKKAFYPKTRFVSILSTGEGQAFFTYGSMSFHGTLFWKLKKSIDLKFMNQFKRLGG